MNSRQLPPTVDALAYWRDGKVRVALHGPEPADDRDTTLTPAQALKLAEQLTRAAREALGA